MQNTPADTGEGACKLGGYSASYSQLDRDCEAACANVRQPHINRILALGVPPNELALLGERQLPFGVLTIDTDDAGRWWPDPAGWDAIVMPVIERGAIVDVIAFHSTRPARWWWREGCGSLLGADVLNDVWPIGPLHVVSTPIGWLAAGGNAVCILDWDCPDCELSPMRDREEIVCDNQMLAARLRRRLAQPRKVPLISYPKEAARA